jgi:hypothetical protein
LFHQKDKDRGFFMDIETLYMMAKAAARNAERACEIAGQNTAHVRGYSGYAAYIGEYNRLVPLVVEQFGEEAEHLFKPIAGSETSAKLVFYSELAAARLSALASYLQTKLGATDRQIAGIVDLVRANLRPAIFDDPEREADVQNALETIFRVRELDYRREKISIPYSSKKYIPDFTFESLDLAVEVKLCRSENDVKVIIDQINADLPAYQTRYRHAMFVVYDLGFIRDVGQFKSGIESNPDVYVVVVKK